MSNWFSRRGSLRSLVLVVALLVAIGLSRCESDDEGSGDSRFTPGREMTVLVTDVVDGDTIEVRLPDGSEEDVRYIGIDTPESVKPDSPVECGGPEASRYNERVVGGQHVLLKFDEEERDRYGRLLAYVYVHAWVTSGTSGGSVKHSEKDILVNALLVRLGFARTLEIEPNTSLAKLFNALAVEAGRDGRGLWGKCGW